MPIRGKTKTLNFNLSAESILKKITEYDIYKFYTPIPFKINRPFSSPLREDKDPSFVIKIAKESGYIYHMDFVHPECRGNSFQYVQQLFKLNYGEALQKIATDFGLEGGDEKWKTITRGYEQPEGIKLPPHITIIDRPFTLEEAKYWSDYHIDISELRKYEIFAIDKLFVDGKRITNPQNRLRFAYRYIVNDKELWKIYTPLIKKECGYKWFTNVPIDTMEGLDTLVKDEKTIITKSRKDLIILKKFLPSVCAAQNESNVSISVDNINLIQSNSQNNYICFDSDEAGKKNSLFYTESYGFKHINVPDYYVIEGIKDFSDLAKAYGMEEVIKHFKQKEII